MSDFVSFASAHGLEIRRLIADGNIHRCPTTAKPRSDNGAYMLDRDRGWIQDWAQGERVIWWQDEHAKPWTEADKAAAEARRRAQAKERTAQARKAALQASQWLSEAELVIPRVGRPWRPGRPALEAIYAHPYLVRKGFPNESGFEREGELLIPMYDCRDYRELVGLQRIGDDKKFLLGQRAKGAVYRFGAGKAIEKWLCEGYATALSVRAGLKKLYRDADVYVCFSAGNIEYVASAGIGTHVMADNDQSGTGQRAAEATGLCWTMPGDVGIDANDLHQAKGIEAVCELMQRRI
jgi:putative DNA primase/helicase